VKVSRIMILVLVGAVPARAQIDPRNPGTTSSPPGTGCQIGTSGCFPTAPPGPITPTTDPGAPQDHPPPEVSPHDVPFFGALPGVSVDARRQPAAPIATQPPENLPPVVNPLVPPQPPPAAENQPTENQPQAPTENQPQAQPTEQQGQPQNQAPQGQAPQNQAPQTQAPQSQAPQGQTPQNQAPQNQAPQSQAPQGQAPQGQAPQGQAPGQ
jgi:hypothetical protein